jgi:hypothetical protein
MNHQYRTAGAGGHNAMYPAPALNEASSMRDLAQTGNRAAALKVQ